ncbi:hypothetical protein Syun_001418 [Stephania yunnanensis]|uniref:Uncharacterized protein n=1 Tax=Stephania yunnanensis TaxID=152371 RepID=A0AAP0LES9_9MAGN
MGTLLLHDMSWQTGSWQQWRNSRHKRGLVEEDLVDNELGVATRTDDQRDTEDSTPPRSSGSGENE